MNYNYLLFCMLLNRRSPNALNWLFMEVHCLFFRDGAKYMDEINREMHKFYDRLLRRQNA